MTAFRMALIPRVIELAGLLYWVPVPTKGSKGDATLAERTLLKQKKCRKCWKIFRTAVH